LSQFSLPRIYFRGRASINPPTGNNTAALCDPVSVVTRDPTTDPPRSSFTVRSESDRQRFLRVAEARTRTDRSHWNYYGDFAFRFHDVRVEAIACSSGLITNRGSDGLIDSSVDLAGAIMIDADPESPITSQVFAERVMLSGPGGHIYAATPPHAARWYNFARINSEEIAPAQKGAAVFQCLLKEVEYAENGSDALRILQATAQSGLFLQYAICNGRARLTNDEIAAEYYHGRYASNPFDVQIEGFLCAADAADLDTVSLGRCLVQSPSREAACGPAFIKVDRARERLMLDLMNTFPFQGELDADGFVADDGTSTMVEIQPIGVTVDASPGAIRRAGGILEIELDSEGLQAAETARLTLVCGEDFLLHELESTLACDTRAVYSDSGQEFLVSLVSATAGQLSGSHAIDITVIPSAMSAEDDEDGPVVALAEPLRAMADRSDFPTWRGQMQDGRLEIRVHARRPGAVHVLFAIADSGDGPDSELEWKLHERALSDLASGGPHAPRGDRFMTIRVLPAYNPPERAEGPLHAEIYRDILQYYDLVFPYMGSRHFSYYSEAHLRANARQIVRRLETDRSTPAYMPPSRDMSEGKRRALLKYLRTLY
jgi:hypothetical protein